MVCSNCGKACDVASLLVNHAGFGYVAALCPDCQKDVLTLKIVLTRENPDERFEFEGFLPARIAKAS